MKRFGLIGYPIDHSLSPELFAAAYPGADMSYDLIEADNIERAIGIFKEGYQAVNVTAPFKADAFRYADTADPVASALKATNLLVKDADGIKAYNTDCLAVMAILDRVDPGRSAKVTVVGCGGAGKAAALASATCGHPTTVINRHFEKAAGFCKSIGGARALPEEMMATAVEDSDLLIYTLPVAVRQLEKISFRNKIIIEANYKDPCLAGYDAGEYVGGLQWLVEQAVAGFPIMTCIMPDRQRLSKCCNK